VAFSGDDGVMPDSPPSTKLPFWIHQALEYLCGLLVVSQAIHASSVVMPVVAGAALILLGATADGPLAAFRLVSRGLHRVLDLVAILLLGGALALFARDGDGAEISLVVVAIVVLVALVFRTNYAPKPVKTRRGAGSTTDDGGLSEEVGRKAGRAVAMGVKYVKAAKAKRDQRR
jgi:uncharacterized membrane protein HdeD (DUF308 family)